MRRMVEGAIPSTVRGLAPSTATELGCCRVRLPRAPKSGKPDLGGGPPCNPAQIRHFAQAAGTRPRPAPTAPALTARLGHNMNPVVRPLPDEAPRPPAALAARRRQIIEMIV